jgi:hypothetical protein
MRMSRELEEFLGHPVDVVSAGGLKDRERHILGESIDLIIGLRIVLAHHCHRVDPNQVWVIATNEFSHFAERLRSNRQD